MQVVILHHHLNRGGVTSVVENHLRSLALLESDQQPARVTIVYGGRAAAWNHELADQLPFELSMVAVPELEYDNFSDSTGQLYDALQRVLNEFDRQTTVLHLHNHSLGKNQALTPTVCRLADEGWRLLLQIHDFAEDLRPANYQHLLQGSDSTEQMQSELYPQAAQIQYAVLNQRDYAILQQAGVSNERVHLLPNPVRPLEDLPDSSQVEDLRLELASSLKLPAGHRFVLYPVRPIRRKNLGELLLWSLLSEQTTFGLTLAPLNPQEITSYERWVELADELELPIRFEVAGKTNLAFEEIYAASEAIVTTSVAEGFGMVYLEASLARRQLVGRSLPGVCDDFQAAGMTFPGLAEEMLLPIDQLDVEEVKQSHVQINRELRASYDLTPDDSTEQLSAQAIFLGDRVDFGRLESSQQRSFLRRVKSEPELRELLRVSNPATQTIGNLAPMQLADTLEHNCRVIAENYSPTVIGKKLEATYRAVLAPATEYVQRSPAIARAILNRFVHPAQLFPIRLEK